MKYLKFILGICLLALLASTATATTEEHPTMSQVTKLVKSVGTSNFIDDAYDTFIEKYPKCTCDVWQKGDKKYISFYPEDEDSPRGWKGVYYNEEAKKITMDCDGTCKPIKSHMGETEVKETEDTDVEENDKEETESEKDDKESVKEEKEVDDKEENVDEEDKDLLTKTSRKIIKESIKTEIKYTYEELEEVIGDYDGKLDCSSKSCAKQLSEYLEEEGWDCETIKKNFKDEGKRYCVAVETEDEGDVYILLG